MLLNFTAKNYKSFADEMCFSMVAAPKQNDLKYSLFEGKAGGQDYKVQCSSVFYGANASGKSNIISAMDTFRAIILRGNIRNSDYNTNPNYASELLELVPNYKKTKSAPVGFSIEFIDGSLKFRYLLSIDIGKFLEMPYKRKIDLEELYINDKFVFNRAEKVKLGEYKHIKDYIQIEQDQIENIGLIINSSLNSEELFLANGFKVIFSPKLVSSFIDWIAHKLMVVYRADSVEFVRKFSNVDKKGIYVEETMSKAVKLFGFFENEVGYYNLNEKESKLCSFFSINEGENKAVIPADVFESYGTVRFANLFPLVLKAFATGSTLVVDEFDASIHPSALMNIINMFHNDSINKNHAQLIFNTHNPIFLNSNLFRRDEIKFVQRDHDTGNSEVYSLSDFGTSGKNGVRNSTDYMKYYLNYNYGAIEDVDFTPIFENIVNNDDSESNGGE